MLRGQLEETLCGPDGLVDVTRIEIEILPTGKSRWTFWDGKRRLLSKVAAGGEVPDMLDRAEIILAAMAEMPPGGG